MKADIRLNAVTRADRNTLISAIGDAVATEGGWIEDVHFFSNISIALHFMIPAQSGKNLAKALSLQALTFDADDLSTLTERAARDDTDELSCALQITFFHDEPDLRRHVPSVPG